MENNVFRGVISRGVEIMAGVSEDYQYISTEWNGATSQKTALFLVHRENLKSHITITEFWSSPFHNAPADNNVYVLLTSSGSIEEFSYSVNNFVCVRRNNESESLSANL